MASSVKLGSVLEDYVDRLVTDGRYGSRSEVLREGVRLVQQREEWLRMVTHKVATGRNQIQRGEGIALDDAFDQVRASIADR